MFISDDGTFLSGTGARSLWLWYRGAPAPVSVGVGAAGGWRRLDTLSQVFIGASPRGNQFTPSQGPPWPSSLGHDTYPTNTIVAGGPYWGASDHDGVNSIGDVPPGYEAWQWHAIGTDGTRILVKNGVYRVFWPAGAAAPDLNLTDVTVTTGDQCVVITDATGLLKVLFADGSVATLAQRPGLKYAATTVLAADGATWLIYSSAQLGRFICHRGDDASQGYDLDLLTVLGPVGPVGRTFPDGRTRLGWCTGPEQQGADMREREVVLGEGMTPFVVPDPSPEPPDPPDPPDPTPEPEPEPDPMPPVDPMKPGKDHNAYLDALAHTISTPGENFLMPFESARQGCLQTWDQLNAAHDWMNGNACVRGACSRAGQSSVIVDPLLWDRVSPIVRAIDLEYLQRG